MANTFKIISSYTVGSGGIVGVTFNNIPQTYTDLLLKTSSRSANSSVSDGILITVNDISTGSYDFRRLVGSGSTAVSATATGNTQMYINFAANGATSTSNTFSNTDIYFSNYTGTSFYKTVSSDASTENNATTSYLSIQGHSFNGTSAITKLYVYNGGNTTFDQYSTFVLYGIKNS